MKIESTYGIGNQSILPSFPIIMKEYVPGVTNPNRGVLTMMVFSKLWSTEAIRSWGLIVQNAQLSNPKIIMEGTARAQKSAEIWFQVETFLSCVSFFLFVLFCYIVFFLFCIFNKISSIYRKPKRLSRITPWPTLFLEITIWPYIFINYKLTPNISKTINWYLFSKIAN